MTSLLRARFALSAALFAALVAASGTSLISPVSAAAAAPTKAPYRCEAEALNGNKLDITFTVATTPANIYVGRTATPKMVVEAIIPGNIVALASFFGVKSASATGNFSVKRGSATTARPFVFPRTDIPQTNKDFPVTINVPLPKLTSKAVGTVIYKPGPIAITLTGYDKKKADAQAGDEMGSIPASCSAKTPNQTLAKVNFIKSPTATTTAATYAKATKKVTSVSKVAAASGVAPTGKATAVLYRGKTKVRTVTTSLVGGKSTAVFTGIATKGAYKVVTTYGGSAAHKGSTRTKTFTIR